MKIIPTLGIIVATCVGLAACTAESESQVNESPELRSQSSGLTEVAGDVTAEPTAGTTADAGAAILDCDKPDHNRYDMNIDVTGTDSTCSKAISQAAQKLSDKNQELTKACTSVRGRYAKWAEVSYSPGKTTCSGTGSSPKSQQRTQKGICCSNSL